MKRRAALFALFAITSCALNALPADASAQEQPIRALRYDLGADLSVSIGSTLFIVAAEYEKAFLTPAACRVCERDPNGKDTLNKFDAFFHQELAVPDPNVPNQVSNITGFVLTPTLTLGALSGIATRDKVSRGSPADFLITYEATSIAVVIDEVTKLIVARERPDLHFSADSLTTAPHPPDSRLSFYSGHTTLTFAIATAAGTVATMRNYTQAPLVWITGMSLATLTGYLRMAAARHYMTDVLVGAAMGALVGFSVPYIFHRALNGATESPAVLNPSAMIGSPGLVQIGGHF
jgi:membrane-associated phospholipid phosphatase